MTGRFYDVSLRSWQESNVMGDCNASWTVNGTRFEGGVRSRPACIPGGTGLAISTGASPAPWLPSNG